MGYTLLADVTPEKVDWFWPGRIPFGKLTILDGDGGLGKSTIMLDLAARLSRGLPLPDGTRHEPAGSVLLMAEDGLADTVQPRLTNAGADLTRIAALETVTDENGDEGMPQVPEDVAAIERTLIAVGGRLLIVDPLMSYLGAATNTRDDKDVRRALMPLVLMAQRTGVAVVALRHLNKMKGSDALYRGGGSVAFISLARSGLLVAKDPDDPTRRVVATNKSNLAIEPPSLVYRLMNCENGMARVQWEGASLHTAQTLVNQGGDDQERGELHEAEEFLRDALDGGPSLATTVQKLARAAGIAERTLKRAKATLRVVSKKSRTQDGQWTWELPPPPPKGEGGQQGDTDPLAQMAPLAPFKLYHEEGQVGQGGQEDSNTRVTSFDTHKPRAGVLAPTTGTHLCVVCNKGTFVAKDRWQVCASCKPAYAAYLEGA